MQNRAGAGDTEHCQQCLKYHWGWWNPLISPNTAPRAAALAVATSPCKWPREQSSLEQRPVRDQHLQHPSQPQTTAPCPSVAGEPTLRGCSRPPQAEHPAQAAQGSPCSPAARARLTLQRGPGSPCSMAGQGCAGAGPRGNSPKSEPEEELWGESCASTWSSLKSTARDCTRHCKELLGSRVRNNVCLKGQTYGHWREAEKQPGS